MGALRPHQAWAGVDGLCCIPHLQHRQDLGTGGWRPGPGGVEGLFSTHVPSPSILFQISAPSFHPKHICMVPSRVGWVKNRGDETGRRLDKRDKASPGLFGTNAAESVPEMPFCSSTHITTEPAELLLGKTGEAKELGNCLKDPCRDWEKNGGKAWLGCTPCARVCAQSSRAPSEVCKGQRRTERPLPSALQLAA